jgi:hypothetical protein
MIGYRRRVGLSTICDVSSANARDHRWALSPDSRRPLQAQSYGRETLDLIRRHHPANQTAPVSAVERLGLRLNRRVILANESLNEASNMILFSRFVIGPFGSSDLKMS